MELVFYVKNIFFDCVTLHLELPFTLGLLCHVYRSFPLFYTTYFFTSLFTPLTMNTFGKFTSSPIACSVIPERCCQNTSSIICWLWNVSSALEYVSCSSESFD